MKISTRQDGSAMIVDVTGDITLQSSPELRKVVLDLFRQKHSPRVIVNMTAVRWIDSAGVASLIEGLKLARELKSGFALFGLNATAKEVLALTKLVNVFDIYATEEDALRGKNNGNPPAR
jgi:anti-sigma B factor antagonist